MRSTPAMALIPALALLIGACGTDSSDPSSPSSPSQPSTVSATTSSGPEVPRANLGILLLGHGFGHIKFRQPIDSEAIIFLDTWVRGLAPNSEYLLQRAVDATVDDHCTSTAWLTLGKGLDPQSIITDEKGTGRANFFRDVSAIPVGSEFDIYFRVVDAHTQAVVLQSGCYQYRVRL